MQRTKVTQINELSQNDFLWTSGPGKDARGITQYKFRKSVTLGQTHIHTKAAVHSAADEADCLSLTSAVWLVLHLALRRRVNFKIQNLTPNRKVFATTGNGVQAPPWTEQSTQRKRQQGGSGGTTRLLTRQSAGVGRTTRSQMQTLQEKQRNRF